MGLALKIGFDADVIGEYRLRDGRIEIVAPDEATRADLDARLDMDVRSMVLDHGIAEDEITAEKVLRWIPEHSSQGRNWSQLVEQPDVSTEHATGGRQ